MLGGIGESFMEKMILSWVLKDEGWQGDKVSWYIWGLVSSSVGLWVLRAPAGRTGSEAGLSRV